MKYIHNNTIYDNKIDVIPDGATELTSDQYEILSNPPSSYHKWNGTEWVPDTSRKQEILAKLEALINAATDQTILSGFSYNGHNFKLSLENQINYKTECELRENLTYPHKIKTIDGYYEMQDASEYLAMYLAAVAFIRQAIETGWAQKDAIQNKTTTELIEMLRGYETP